MFIDLSNDRARTEELQRMLRFLSFAYGEEALMVRVNGEYDKATTDAVRYYQGINDLPQSGKVDIITWDLITEEYQNEARRRAPVYIYPIPRDPNHINRVGERSDVIMILQIILGALGQNYDYPAPPISGVYGRETAEAVRYYQEANGLDVTGEADRETWRRLSEEYNALVSQ
ncbi:MAG: peptidoglycan-binding protein [Clostridia bacterium]|nr:peptidoglycan-binding protein [Clostridia bacterium]